jgi:uncharacterized protein (TIGR02391 family)
MTDGSGYDSQRPPNRGASSAGRSSFLMEAHRLLRDIAAKALDAALAEDAGEGLGVVTIAGYIDRSMKRLAAIWPTDADRETLSNIEHALADTATQRRNFHYLAELALEAGAALDDYYTSTQAAETARIYSALDLFEPEVIACSLHQLEQGLYRDAVFNAFVAVFDLLRVRTGLDEDGASLVAHALSLDDPKLAVGDLSTTSGQNEQKGIIQMLQGAFLGIRNPAAHTLTHAFDERKARQCLVVASFLIRRIKEAQVVL